MFTSFELFGILHWLSIVITLVVFGFSFKLKLLSDIKLKQISKITGYIIFSFLPIFQTYILLFDNWSIKAHLPLHISSFIILWLALALITGYKYFINLAFWWGVPGGIVSVLLPDLTAGINETQYWFFWISHGIIFTAIHLILIIYKPIFKITNLVVPIVALTIYILCVTYINNLLDSNYGYLKELPSYLRN